MRNLLLFAFIALVHARPEGGYGYVAPAQERGGSYSSGLSSGHSVTIASEAVGAAGYESGYSHGVNTGYSSQGVGIASHGNSEGIGLIGGGSGSIGGISAAGGYQSVHKHIYVHVPPSGFEEHIQPRLQTQFTKPQKHYKIIFIKAPSAPTYQQPIIPPAPQNEEKTLIYVLAKRPEEPADIVLPSPPSTPPSKPEVYFIKYQARREGIADGGASIGGGAGIAVGTGAGVSIGNAGGNGISGHIVQEDGHGGIHGETGAGIDVRSGVDEGSHHITTISSSNYGPPGKSGPY